ncbi:HAMP domain-containing histidine kinase [Sphingomonas sp. NBWT7]|uniref:ATP-binding protein n=1 Tax=Sphingomonas sp. NBWT7 TaxID=2596913 RepID=UPI0016288503|nr:ATP-binding protein [Sphingomonas sp. NBWT7]QNE30699.1 HAMP domain-containing histidine kinase [Sphingomonas sp. NBWT7]
METPLLALTRSPPAGPLADTAAAENMRQLIQLRWIAVAGQLFTILAVDLVLGVPLALVPMLGVVALLAFANLVSAALLARHRVTNIELLLALFFDVGSLTAQLWLSGGASNPFISLYLLQVVLGAILLESWSVWVLVVVTALCYAALGLWGRALRYPADLVPLVGDLNALGAWISFGLTSVLLAMFVTRISRNLRARDAYVAALRQRAAEEDGIVRMGLFASGAAHELGTPLASLAVILSDWRRLPRIAADPELAGEVDEMQAEVQRCKAIVTDVLHSAGEPRGEAMESVVARDFLIDAAEEWRATQPSIPCAVTLDTSDDAAVVAGPALRQAIWNLLDNAAEASPRGIAIGATCDVEELTIAVTDRGAGFASEQLAGVGKLYQSSKGAGHGVGLFLASNVARRLGGRLEAHNRAGGGAEVRLVLPLAIRRRGDR